MTFEVDNLQNLTRSETKALKIAYEAFLFRSIVSARHYPFTHDPLAAEANSLSEKHDGLSPKQVFDFAARANWADGEPPFPKVDRSLTEHRAFEAEIPDGTEL